MLDEWKEYEQYTADLTAADVPRRMRYDNLTDSFASVPRAMTIIARRALDGQNTAERVGFARGCLQLWCGHAALDEIPAAASEEDRALQSRLAGWFPRYLALLAADKRAAGREKAAEKLEKRAAQFAERGKRYDMPELDADRAEKESDLRAICYESVIADAINAGPLRTRYLVVASGLDEAALFQGVKMKASDVSSPKLAHAPKWRTQILKLTAMYLLGCCGKARGAVSFKLSDADTYLQTNTAAKEKNEPDLFQRMKLDGEQIFQKESFSNAICRLRASAACLARGGFVLAAEDELQNYPGALYYADGTWAQKLLVPGTVKAP